MNKKDKFFVASEEIGIPSQNIELPPTIVTGKHTYHTGS